MARRSSQFDFFTASWMGDDVKAAWAKLIDKTLRKAGYETRKLARARLIRREYWKMRTFARSAARLKRIKDRRFRGYTFQTWRVTPDGVVRARGRRRKYQPSRPGESPTNQTNVLKASITYDFVKEQGTIASVIGPVALPKSEHWSFTGGQATHALEHGGYTTNHQGKKVYIAARPFMRPAQEDLIRSGFFDRAFAGQLSRHVRPTRGRVVSGYL